MGTAIGIDLGTTNTVVAAVRDGRAVTLDDEQGRRLIPSVVSFHPSGQVLVGQPAKERRYNDPSNTVYSVKRLIGRPWKSQEVQESLTRFPFELREGPKETTMAVVRGEQYALPEISAFVLRRAKQIAEARLGETVDRAVITVPANFNDLQRAATKVAGKLAGLEVLRILNEPTAAALAYGQSIAQSERIAIYDLGGGTFDVTLLDLSGSVFEVLATAGDTSLGGDDIDVLVADRIATQLREIHRFDARANPEAFGRLRLLAEDLKIRLSTEEELSINVTDIAHGEGGAPLSMRFRLNRTELEHIAKPLIEKTMEVARFAIDTIGLRRDQFERIILVGGSTRMPLVARRVEEFFGRPPFLKVNPDEVVALGAAIQAFSLNKDARKPPAARYGPDSTISGVTQTQVTMQTIQTVQTQLTQQTMLTGGAPTIERTVPPEILRASVTQPGFAPLPPRPAAGVPMTKEDDPFASLDEMPRGPAAGTPSSATIKAAAAAGQEDPSMSFKVQLPDLDDPTLTKNTKAPIRPQAQKKPPPLPSKKPPVPSPSQPKGLDAEDPSMSFDVGELPDQNTSVSIARAPAELDFSALDEPAQPDRSIPSITAPLAAPAPRVAPPQMPAAPPPPPAPLPLPLVAQPNTQIRAAEHQPYEPPLPLVLPHAAPAAAPDDGGIPAKVAPLLIDVTPLSLSVETVGGYCDVLIPANSPVPCDRTRIFLTAADGQTVVCVNVAQGESRKFLENTFLGQLDLHGLEPKDRGEVKIAVTFEIDADGILNVRAKDVQTGQERQARMRLLGASTSAEVAAMLARQAQHEVH